jgi:hypothetical protein
MDRSEIRVLTRIEADELTEANQGLFTDDHLDILLNVAQSKLALKLITIVPWMFRKSKVFAYTAAKTSYDIATDLVITDLLVFETIVHNKTNESAKPLYFVESPNDLWQYGYVGATGTDPKAWAYLDNASIAILPTASGTVADRLKAFYFKRIEDMDDDADEPDLDAALHPLIAYEVLLRWMIRDKDSEIYRMVAAKAALEFEEAMNLFAMKQGFTTGRLPGAQEYLDHTILSTNLVNT